MKKFMISLGVILSFVFILVLVMQFANNKRYSLYLHPTFRADQYLLDSKTGKVWHMVESKNKMFLWEEMPKVDLPLDFQLED